MSLATPLPRIPLPPGKTVGWDPLLTHSSPRGKSHMCPQSCQSFLSSPNLMELVWYEESV